MALLKSEIIDKVKLNLNSAGVGTYYSDDDLNDCFADVYDDIVCHALPFEKSTEISMVGNKVYYDLYSTIQDYILPLSIYHQESNRWLVQKSERYLENINSQWEQRHGNPIYFVVIDYKYIALYPHVKEDGGTLTLYYKYRPQVHADSDSVVLSNHSDLVFTNGMTEDLLAQSGEYQKSMGYFQDYFKQMKEESDLLESRSSPDRIYRLAMQELRNNNGRQ